MKLIFRLAGSLALSAIFLYLAARGVSWAAVREAMGSAHLSYVALMAAGTALPLVFRAWRWGLLVHPLQPVRFGTLFSATSIGFGANMLLPLRAGEVVRPWVLSRRTQIPFVQAMATVALERLFDMAVLLLLFSIATLTLPIPPEWKRYGWFFLTAFSVALAMLFLVRRVPGPMLRAAESVYRLLPTGLATRLLEMTRNFVDGLVSLGDARTVAIAAAHSLGVWLSIAISFGAGLWAFDLEVPTVRAALTTTTFVAIAVSIPGGPGFIGMFQAGCVVALEVFGVPKSLAFSYSVLTHLVQFATTVALGLYFFVREGFRLTDIRELEGSGDFAAGAERGNRNVGTRG